MTEKKKLFTEFPPVSTDQWEAKIAADLKGADYEKRLVWKTLEGFPVRPYYRGEDLANLENFQSFPGEAPFTRGNNACTNEWEIRQDFPASDPTKANKAALDALAKGATSIGFDLGLNKADALPAGTIQTLVKDIDLMRVSLHFNAGNAALQVLQELLAISPAGVMGSVDFDPLGYLTLKGTFYGEKEFPTTRLGSVAKLSIDKLPGFHVVTVNARYFQEAGATLVQELAYALSIGNAYLEALTNAGLTIDQAASLIRFNFAVSTNYFMEIAKFRAARMLWYKIVEAYKPSNTGSGKMFIHACTAKWSMTTYDPYVNVLRATTESMSSALGGINSLSVTPFDATYREETALSNRIARNTQIILKEEAYFDKIVDPGAGSYYIETLTSSIAANSWKLFVETEEKGGYEKAFLAGAIQAEIEATCAKRKQNMASRREILLGTNQYPNFNEEVKDAIDPVVYKTAIVPDANPVATPIRITRAAEEFEWLRVQTEQHGKKPRVCMLPIGNLSMRKARATFAANFFACAGYEVIDHNGFETIEEGVKELLGQKADVIVICSSDDEYAELAPNAFKAIDGKAKFVVAGNPKAILEELKAAGIQHFIHVQSNLLETLQEFHRLLGIK